MLVGAGVKDEELSDKIPHTNNATIEPKPNPKIPNITFLSLYLLGVLIFFITTLTYKIGVISYTYNKLCQSIQPIDH